MTTPEPVALPDDAIIKPLRSITVAFCTALVGVGLVGVLWIVPDPTVTTTGLVIGAALGLVAWFLPTAFIRNRLDAAARSGVPPEAVPLVVRIVVMPGLAFAEGPALLGFALTFAMGDGNDVAPFVLSIPLAVASLICNVSGPGAVRRHLERLRGTPVF